MLVLDQYDGKNNGTTITACRLADGLRTLGYEVKVVSTGKQSTEKFRVPELWLPPLIKPLIQAQGMQFALPQKKILYEAIQWADIVHFVMPFFLSIQALKIAQKLGVPHTAAFHVQPQNITYSIGLGTVPIANEYLYHIMRERFFKHFRHIHCPSRFIANQLKERGYTAELHIISNGVAPEFVYTKTEKPAELYGRFIIVMIGRLSKEKRQDVLIKAVRLSRYADSIQLIFAGKGPLKKRYETESAELTHKPIFTFCGQEELIRILSYTDLYVHTADVEIEAISCLEALSCGLVPIIADSSQSATPQFVLDNRSLFTAGSPEALAEKIDYWLDHPEERKKQEYAYAEHGKHFSHESCVQKMVEMFHAEVSSSHKQQSMRIAGKKDTMPE
ncbi:MAG: glycosyltransferase [Treponema sp.]